MKLNRMKKTLGLCLLLFATSAYSATPATPSKVTASKNLTQSIQLNWQANTGIFDFYEVFRSDTTTGAKTMLATTTTPTFTDLNLTPNQNYFYTVKACLGNQCSGFSTAVTGTATAMDTFATTSQLPTTTETAETAPVIQDDDDILDLVMPAILAAAQKSKQSSTSIVSIPLNLEKKKTTAWILGFAKDVYVKRNGSFAITPQQGYRFCAYRSRSESRTSNATVYARKDLPDKSMAHIYYDVPCGGGGMSIKDANKLISSAIVATVMYFTAGTGSSIANVLGNASYSDLLYASTWTDAPFFLQTVNSLLNQGLLSSGISNVLNMNSTEGQCGVGDAGSWLITNLDFISTRTELSCEKMPYPEWQML